MASLVRITISADSLEQLREVIGREDMDLNCGGARSTPSGAWTVEAYVTEQVAATLAKAGVRLEIDKEFMKRAAARSAEVGAGDRFQGGRTPPRGVGRKE